MEIAVFRLPSPLRVVFGGQVVNGPLSCWDRGMLQTRHWGFIIGFQIESLCGERPQKDKMFT